MADAAVKGERTAQPRVYVLVLNWNGWRDTIECLESIFRLDYSNYRVMVCDNGSTDGSLERIAAWANGEITAECADPGMKHLTVPHISKPIPFVRVKPGDGALIRRRCEKLLLVQTGSNLGFAGGNNVGLQLALAAGDMGYAWLLNNDTVVDHNALTTMIYRMTQCPAAGMCGSTLLYYYDPRTVQALAGARYNPWTARVREVGRKAKIEDIAPTEQVEHELGYISGASMLVSRRLQEQVGLLGEEYFLYFEEIDWATRSRDKFSLAYSPKSLVYHKDGASSGTSRRTKRRAGQMFFRDRWASPLSEFYAARNRVLFTSRYYPFALPSVVVAILLGGMQRLLYGRIPSFMALARGLLQGSLRAATARGAAGVYNHPSH